MTTANCRGQIRAPSWTTGSIVVLFFNVSVVGCSGSSSSGTSFGAAHKRVGGAPDEVTIAAQGFDAVHQEQYHPIRKNEFLAVAINPISTFSAAVNTASNSNIRRFLSEGKRPPKDAVFIAEMVNYFPYKYPN